MKIVINHLPPWSFQTRKSFVRLRNTILNILSQKSMKSIVKKVLPPSVVHLNFMKMTRILFVRKENKNNDFIQQFVAHLRHSSAILENPLNTKCVHCSVSAAPHGYTVFVKYDLLNKVILFSLHTKSILVASKFRLNH